MVPESASTTLLVRKDAPTVDVTLDGLKVPLTKVFTQLVFPTPTDDQLSLARNAMFGSGNGPCAPRTQILASRLLDIIIHDEICVGDIYSQS